MWHKSGLRVRGASATLLDLRRFETLTVVRPPGSALYWATITGRSEEDVCRGAVLPPYHAVTGQPAGQRLTGAPTPLQGLHPCFPTGGNQGVRLVKEGRMCRFETLSHIWS